MDMVGLEHEKRAAFPLLVASCSGQIITITYLSKTETEDQDFRPIQDLQAHSHFSPQLHSITVQLPHLWITKNWFSSQFDSGDSSMSGPSSFVLFSFFHFMRRF